MHRRVNVVQLFVVVSASIKVNGSISLCLLSIILCLFPRDALCANDARRPTFKNNINNNNNHHHHLFAQESKKVTLKMHDLKMTDKENYGSGKCRTGK